MTQGCIEFSRHCAFFPPFLPLLFLFSQQVPLKCRNKMKAYVQQTQRITLLSPEGVYLITTGAETNALHIYTEAVCECVCVSVNFSEGLELGFRN